MPLPPDLHSDTFTQLVRQLEEQHKREVATLYATIVALRRQVSEGPRGPLYPCSNWKTPGIEVVVSPSAACQGKVVEEGEEEGDGEDGKRGWKKGIVFESMESEEDAVDKLTDGVGSEFEPEPVTSAEAQNTDVQPQRQSSKSTAGASVAPNQKRSAKFARIALGKPREDSICGGVWGHVFDALNGICIMLNIMFIFLGLDYEGYQIAVGLNIRTPGQWPDLDSTFYYGEHFFCLVFLIDLLIRLKILRKRYFYNNSQVELFNITDASVVVYSCIDLYILRAFSSVQESNFTVLRALRFFRLVRALRVIRTFDFFTKLRILIGTFVASFLALIWSMVLVFLTMLMFSLVMCQLIHPYFSDPSMSDSSLQWMYHHYGTAGRSLWTVFELTFSGCWPNYARPLIEDVSTVFAYIFAVYIFVVVFAMTRIITALFLKDTLQVAASDAELVIQEKTNEKKAYAQKLMDFFETADVSADGVLSYEEFASILQEPRVKSYLAALELATHETKTLFEMLDDGDGQVTAEEFVQGALRLKGSARSQDVITMMHDVNSLKRSLEDIQTGIDGIATKLKRKSMKA